MEVLIEGIPLEKLLEVYYKDLERKKKNLERIKRYRKTEKGRLNNLKNVKKHKAKLINTHKLINKGFKKESK